MMEILRTIWERPRHLISDGYDEALAYLASVLPLQIREIPTGKKCWTWVVPEKWNVREAFIEDMDGNRLLDLKEHPLHVVSYSLPIDRVVNREELLAHIHTRVSRPGAIPYEFKYYERDWGFCIQYDRLKEFTKDRYRVRIDSSFEQGALKVGEYVLKGKRNDEIVLVAHLCHPAMANDDATGVAVLMDVAKELQKKERDYSYRFLILPETIGSIAYLSSNEHLIGNMKWGIFLEMLGNDNIHALQLSRRGNTRLDLIARHVMKKRLPSFREGEFRRVVGNDEMVFDGPGVGVPMISLSRYPYPEYHTSDDNLGIVSEQKMEESKNIVMEILEILDKDYIPARTFTGPVFLSGNGLWVDWRVNKELNANIQHIMLRMEGKQSIFEIAQELGMKFEDVYAYIERFREKGFVVKRYDYATIPNRYSASG